MSFRLPNHPVGATRSYTVDFLSWTERGDRVTSVNLINVTPNTLVITQLGVVGDNWVFTATGGVAGVLYTITLDAWIGNTTPVQHVPIEAKMRVLPLSAINEDLPSQQIDVPDVLAFLAAVSVPGGAPVGQDLFLVVRSGAVVAITYSAMMAALGSTVVVTARGNVLTPSGNRIVLQSGSYLAY